MTHPLFIFVQLQNLSLAASEIFRLPDIESRNILSFYSYSLLFFRNNGQKLAKGSVIACRLMPRRYFRDRMLDDDSAFGFLEYNIGGS